MIVSPVLQLPLIYHFMVQNSVGDSEIATPIPSRNSKNIVYINKFKAGERGANL